MEEKNMLTANQVEDNFEQVKWRCRRGMLELDLMLNKFFNEMYRTLNLESKILFQKMLTATDPELYAWLLGHELPEDKSLQDLILIIRYLYK
jgi:antitoxin CptB